MDKRPCIDIHAHYYPETFLELIAADGAEFGATVSTSNPKGPVIDVDLLHAGPPARKFIDLDERVAEMDAQGVRVQALSLTQPMVDWAGGGLSKKLAETFNDALSDAHQAYPERLVGLAPPPLCTTRPWRWPSLSA